VFAQLMGHLPLTFSHLDQFLAMAFAQVTFRESLRGIETCLRAHSSKLFHLGIRGRIACSTLADTSPLTHSSGENFPSVLIES
jgi:hypothetical protein